MWTLKMSARDHHRQASVDAPTVARICRRESRGSPGRERERHGRERERECRAWCERQSGVGERGRAPCAGCEGESGGCVRERGEDENEKP
jgi:hypothetical protein